MVTQTSNHAPEQKTRRERRIEILQERRRIKKIVKKLRPVTFDNDTVTEAGNFQFLARFKELIGLDALIESHFHLEQKANCIYTAGTLVDHLLDCALLGYTRFQHMNALQSDPGYQIITGIDRFPDESTFRGFLSKLSWSHLIQLVALNRDLLAHKARTG
ncbi:IS1380 family transposase, partial [Effusibacillus consociatus]